MLQVIAMNNEVRLQGSFKGSFEERVLSGANGAFVSKQKLEKLLKATENKTQKNLVLHMIKNFPMSLVNATQVPKEMLERSDGEEIVVIDLMILELIMQELRLEIEPQDFEKLDTENRLSIMKLKANMN